MDEFGHIQVTWISVFFLFFFTSVEQLAHQNVNIKCPTLVVFVCAFWCVREMLILNDLR